MNNESVDQNEVTDSKEPTSSEHNYRQFVFGEEALKISPGEPYCLRRPIRRGHLNISQHYPMQQVDIRFISFLLHDIEISSYPIHTYAFTLNFHCICSIIAWNGLWFQFLVLYLSAVHFSCQSQVLEDLHCIWEWILIEKLHIPLSERNMYSAIIVVPETFDNRGTPSNMLN